MKTDIKIAKVAVVVSFIVLLFCTYYLRSHVLLLNRTRFEARKTDSDQSMQQRKDEYPMRVAEYEAESKQYEIEMAHHEEMLNLYRTNYEEYVKRRKDRYAPPGLPRRPHRPTSPEASDRMAKIGAQFTNQQYDYFDKTSRLNWVACAAALALVGSLLYLLMFDIEGKRLFYVVVLALSFVFMIGPSFHSLLSAVVGFMRGPAGY